MIYVYILEYVARIYKQVKFCEVTKRSDWTEMRGCMTEGTEQLEMDKKSIVSYP